jgi:YD repeat-containing protein
MKSTVGASMHSSMSTNKLVAFLPALLLLSIAATTHDSRAASPECYGSSSSGTKVCVKPVVSPWGYGACDSSSPYQWIDALWCESAGGTWRGYYDPNGPCQGAVSDPYNEALTIQIADTFMWRKSGHTPSGDTRWDGGTYSNYNCWNGTPRYTPGGILYFSSALRTYTNQNGPDYIFLRRDREVTCPKTVSSYLGSNSQQICEPNQEYPQCPAGNPITPGTGRKIQIEQDEVFEGRPVRRYYKSSGNLELWIDQPVTEAKYWADEFDLKLVVDPNAYILGSTSSPDGFVQVYKLDGSPILSTGSTSTRLVKSGVNYFLYQQDSLILFGPDGRMLSSTTADGKQLTFTYADGTIGPNGATATDSGATPVAVPAGTLLAVNSWTGRSIQYQRRKSGLASGMVIQPQGLAVTYEFGSGEQVSKVNYPDATARTYHYGESAFREALTGISRHDSAGNVVRSSTYRYDGNGRAIATEAAGATNKFDLSWTAQSATVVDTTVLSPLGTASQVRYSKISNVWKPVWSSQAAGAGCSASTQATSYDANGNVESETDFNGNRVCKAHDLTRNLESVRVEGLASTATCSAVTGGGAAVPSGARKLSTQWHPDWRLETRRAEPKKITTFVYNGQPDPTNGGAVASCAPAGALLPDGKPIVVLCKTVEQATTDADGSQGFSAAASASPRITSATYNQRGQVLTRTDPRNFTTTYSYYGSASADSIPGDLQSITNPAGHVTQYTRFDKAGRVLRMVEVNGLITNTTYNPRGWVTDVTVTPAVGAPQVTTYTHTDTGQLSTVTLPDGSTMSYAYDTARRLTGITDGAGNTVTYTLDNAGNRTAEQYNNPGGALARNISRVFDALGRLQIVTGAPQ